eukprot:CAMPEP_0197429658 /NCGR_PEP_ID=MMETSP1170-20131217/44723_1 /TAXON_ID=54406 /ORGANISM="Sarcinochrysis sp, Strain CCMP770" /LENGTH=76 /DNA_ID=CAMNT_0042957517 /DNA_START=33 /DNA_END=259 /DNA_ORIENTATION=-
MSGRVLAAAASRAVLRKARMALTRGWSLRGLLVPWRSSADVVVAAGAASSALAALALAALGDAVRSSESSRRGSSP